MKSLKKYRMNFEPALTGFEKESMLSMGGILIIPLTTVWLHDAESEQMLNREKMLPNIDANSDDWENLPLVMQALYEEEFISKEEYLKWKVMN